MLPDLIEQQQQEIETLRERIRQLEQILVPDDAVTHVEWGLTASEAKVFAHLTTRDICTKQSIMYALYTGRIDEDPEPKIVDVFICKIRKKVEKYGVQIETVWGQGYSLTNRADYRSKVTEGAVAA
jgi:two-component system cell cycle response regulator CtrA